MFTTITILTAAFLGFAAKVAWDFIRNRRRRQSLADRAGKWWRSGLADPPDKIEYRHQGQVKSGRPVRASGLHLVVEAGARGMILIGAGEAVDVKAFWKAWNYHGGNATKYIDEDGDEYTPGE